MSNTTAARRSPDEMSVLGDEILRNRIEPKLGFGDKGKFVAIDVNSGDFEIDEDDFTAIHRLSERIPSAEVWLGRAWEKSAYNMGWRG